MNSKMASHYKDVVERLDTLRSDPESEQPSWAIRPKDQAFIDAQNFVSTWPSEGIPMPNVGLADDGEVNFLWEGPRLHVDLGFFGDGTYSCYARAPGIRVRVDEVSARHGIFPALQEIFSLDNNERISK